MPTHHLIFRNMRFKTNKLEIHPIGMATFKKLRHFKWVFQNNLSFWTSVFSSCQNYVLKLKIQNADFWCWTSNANFLPFKCWILAQGFYILVHKITIVLNFIVLGGIKRVKKFNGIFLIKNFTRRENGDSWTWQIPTLI